MRRWLEEKVDAVFPGVGLRPLYLSLAATWLMVLYHHHGGVGQAPAWFLRATQAAIPMSDPELHGHLWAHALAVVLLLLTPLAICAVFEGWSPRDLGFRLRGAGPEIGIALALWAAVVPLVWLVHDTEAFARVYPRLAGERTSAMLFAVFEGAYLLKWIAWEFFFRGFLLFGLGKDFLNRSVLVSTIPFTLMHYGKPELEMASAAIAGLVLCWLSLRSKSIWPGVLLHWLVASTMDFMASSFWR